MCLVSGDAKVSNTQILSFATLDGKRQVMVYSNKMDINSGGFGNTSQPVAMILPFPEGDCEMLDIGEATTLFSRIDDLFNSMSRGYGASLSREPASGRLEVKRCGSYRYSVVPGLADFSRLGNNVFNLSSNVMGALNTHYSVGYSFLVCIIDVSAKYAPIAYVHRLRRATGGGGELNKSPEPKAGEICKLFVAEGEKQLFIPTRHEHSDGRADWDHAIYISGNTSAGRATDLSLYRDTTMIDLRDYLPPVLAALAPEPMPPNEFRKIEITSYHPNVDLVYSVKTPPPETEWSPLAWILSFFWDD